MKKVLKYKILFISILVFSINILFNINIEEVKAGYSIKPTTGGGGVEVCTQGDCLNTGTSGIRFALVDENGVVVPNKKGEKTIKDYWYFFNPNSERYGYSVGSDCGNNCGYGYLFLGSADYYYAFKKRFLKQDIMTKDKTYLDTFLDCQGPNESVGIYTSFTSFEDLYNSSDVDSKRYVFPFVYWDDGYPSFTAGIKPHVRRANSAEYIAQIIKDQAEEQKKYTMLNNILKELGYGDNASKTIVNKGYYLQIEPLVTWGNRRNGVDHIFYGTPSELVAFMYRGVSGSGAFNYSYINDFFFSRWYQYGIYADSANSMPKNFNAVSTYTNSIVGFFTPYNNKYNAYGVGYISLEDIGIPVKKCPQKVMDAYNKFVKGKSDSVSSDASTKKYDAAVDAACKEVGISNCEWLKWLNNGGNFRNYELRSKLESGKLDSCEKPSCNTVASIRKDLDFKDVYGKGYYIYIKNLVRVMIGLNVEDGVDASKIWSTKSLQQAIELLKINYGSQFDFGSLERVNNIVLYQVFGKTSSNYCYATSCKDVLNYLTDNRKKMNNLSAKTGGKYNITQTKLEMLYALYPDYDMLSPDMLMDDSGKIDYSLASCTPIPKCNIEGTINASCKKGENKFTFSDATRDDSFNGNKPFTMTSSIFAKLTAKNADVNPTCLNQGYAYTRVNGVRLEKKNMQKSKTTEEYNTGTTNCWESVTFDLPTSIDKDNSIEAGNLFRWGKGDIKDTKSNIYGEMTIKRYCSIEKNSSATKKDISTEWANVVNGKPLVGATTSTSSTSTTVASTDYNKTAKVNPTIKLHYQEAVPSSYASKYPEKEYNLDVELMSVLTNIYERESDGTVKSKFESDYIDYSIPQCSVSGSTVKQCADALEAEGYLPDDHPRKTTVNKSSHPKFFNNGGVIETTAKYNIVYTKDLNWFSDKSDHFKRKTEKELKSTGKNVKDAKYKSLGYGLPTSFVTPSIPHKSNFYYGFNYDSSTNGGKMYITISNIGTKTSSGFHFNNLLKTAIPAINDDDTNSINSNELVYSCGFNISNHIYCNECEYEKKPLITCTASGLCKPNDIAPKDIDVVFRTVELVDSSNNAASIAKANLEKAFPGRSGSGRKRGQNWTMVFGTEIDDDALDDILTDKIYNSKPKYVIDLDSVTIKKIREKNSKDSYTSLSDYKFANKKYSKEFGFSEAINSILKGRIMTNCTNLGITDDACYKSRIIGNIYSILSTGSSGKISNGTIDYTYAASDFLSDLIKDKKLKGVCAKESDSKTRAEQFSLVLGC